MYSNLIYHFYYFLVYVERVVLFMELFYSSAFSFSSQNFPFLFIYFFVFRMIFYLFSSFLNKISGSTHFFFPLFVVCQISFSCMLNYSATMFQTFLMFMKRFNLSSITTRLLSLSTCTFAYSHKFYVFLKVNFH